MVLEEKVFMGISLMMKTSKLNIWAEVIYQWQTLVQIQMVLNSLYALKKLHG